MINFLNLKSLSIFFFLTGFCFFVKAQSYATIKDKDGYVNIRKDRSNTSPILFKLFDDDIFLYDEDDKSNWVKIYIENSKFNQIEGFIYKSKILPLSKLKSIKNTKIFKNSCTVTNDSIKVSFKEITFNLQLHKLTYQRVGSPKTISILTKIDGYRFWGTDGEIPKKALSMFKVTLNGVLISVPAEAINDLYEPNFKSLHVFINGSNTIYIEMDNGDGAGSYSVFWTFKNGKYLKRFIDTSMV